MDLHLKIWFYDFLEYISSINSNHSDPVFIVLFCYLNITWLNVQCVLPKKYIHSIQFALIESINGFPRQLPVFREGFLLDVGT